MPVPVEVPTKRKSHFGLIIIIIIIILMIGIGLILFYSRLSVKKSKLNTTSPVKNKIVIKTNPFSGKLNPLKEVKTNPFR